MRSAAARPGLLLLGLLLAPAVARATLLPFTATLRFQVQRSDAVTLAPAYGFSVSGSGVADVQASGGHLTAVSIPAGVLAASGLAATVTLGGTPSTLYPLSRFLFTFSNGSGMLAQTGGGGFGGTLPLFGLMKVCLFSCGIASVPVPLGPLGGGGTAQGSLAPWSATLHGAAWTTQGTGTFFAQFPVTPPPLVLPGARHGPASLTSSTALASGSLQLVTPAVLSVSQSGGDPVTLVEIESVLTLHFVPEPATGLLLGLAVSLLAAIGRRQARR
jgi:hypothetical protein